MYIAIKKQQQYSLILYLYTYLHFHYPKAIGVNLFFLQVNLFNSILLKLFFLFLTKFKVIFEKYTSNQR